MKYFGKITHDKDLVTKEYADAIYESLRPDLSLSGTSEKPLANRVLRSLFETIPVNWYLDEETSFVRLVNMFGDTIGDPLPNTGNMTYTPKLTNLMESRVFAVSAGATVALSYAYESVDENKEDDGAGIGVLTVNGVSTDSFNVPQGNNTYNVTSLLSPGTNTVTLQVTNSEGNPRTCSYIINVLTLSLTADVSAYDAYYGPVTLNYVLTGYGSNKVVHFELDGAELQTDTVSTSGATSQKVIPAQTAGLHTLRIWATVSMDGVTVTSDVITTNMLWTTAEFPAIQLSSGQHAIRYFNLDGTYLYGYAANYGDAAKNPVTTEDINAPTMTGTSEIQYAFSGWTNLPTTVSKDTAVIAAYDTQYLVRYMNNGVTYATEWVNSGDDADGPTNDPSRSETSSIYYQFAGWTKTSGGTTADTDALENITAARTLYSVYNELGKFTVRFMNGETVLQTMVVVQGNSATYTGSTPTSSQDGYVFTGWLPDGTNIQAATDCVAQFRDINTPVSKYLARTMTAYESDTATKVAQYAFYQNTALQTVETTATTIEQYAFSGCTNLESVETNGTTGVSIAQYAFQNCSKLEIVDLKNTGANTLGANSFASVAALAHLIIRSETVSTLSATSALAGTKIASGTGAIYVPAELVDSYKAASNWSTYASQIFPISAYPKTDFSTVTDSWAEIVANANYATDYVVGDTKQLDLGTKGKVYMQLVAMDTDDLADNTGKARMTWIAKSIIENHAMNSTQKTADGTTSWTAGGWGNCEMRTYLRETILPLMPEVLQNNIKEVTKTYRVKSPTDETASIADTVWIPSYKEVGFTNASYIENDGVVYSGVFNSNANRIKYQANGSANSWWLRSAYSANRFSMVDGSGSENSNYAYNASGLVLGFCI